MKALILDTETSGLVDNHILPLHKQASIIEFYGAVCDLESGEVIEELDLLIKPPKPLTEEIIKITRLTDADLKDKPVFEEVASTIIKFLETAPMIIGHNLSFDTEMLDIEAERLGLTINWPRRICSVEQTIWVKGHRLSLSALHEMFFERAIVDAHRARPDVNALIRCCVEMNKRGWL